jgi:protein ImuB
MPVAPAAARIACLLVPDLPLRAELRAEPELAGEPLAIASAPGPRAEIVAVSPEAARAGVRSGMHVVHARATCSRLRVRVLSLARDQAARDALLDAALSTSPRAEPAPPASSAYAAEAAVFVDARGVAALFRSEASFAGALAERARRLGLPACVAVAGSRSVAQIAARQLAYDSRREGADADASRARPGAQRGDRAKEAGPVRVIAPGEEARFLAPLPLDLLCPGDAEAEALSRLGLRRIADLLRLEERALVTRLGPGIRPLLALARGEDRAPPPPVPPERRLEEASDLEAPLAALEPLAFVLRGLLDRLAERLACRGLAFGDLELALRIEGGGRDARRIGIAAPTLDLRVVLRLALLALEASPPRAAVEAVCVATCGSSVRGDQLDFFRPAGPTPGALARTLAELAALVGPARVGAPAVADDHHPGAYRMEPFRIPPSQRAEAALPASGSALAVRALRPPLPARVRVAGGRPAWLESALANGRIERAAGPWRSSGRWWSPEERFAFDHYDVTTGDGWVVRLRLDLLHRRWEIDAVYD